MRSFSLILFLGMMISFISACKDSHPVESVYKIAGETMGTYYNVRYVGSSEMVMKAEIDSLLVAINAEVSTYIPSSTISRINSSAEQVFAFSKEEHPHFCLNYEVGREMYNLTNGVFEPTLAPLVAFWGFGYDKQAFAQKDTNILDSIGHLVGFDKWETVVTEDSLTFSKPLHATIDFSAIAKGGGVDEIGLYFEYKGVKNFFIDIGGEVLARGTKPQGNPWVIGVNTPLENASATDAVAYLRLENTTVATSGNYRSFYEEDGQKFTHIINPHTYRPAKSDLLSATVIHESCMYADAMATVLMVTGLEKAKNILSKKTDYAAYLLFFDKKGNIQSWHSDSFPINKLDLN